MSNELPDSPDLFISQRYYDGLYMCGSISKGKVQGRRWLEAFAVQVLQEPADPSVTGVFPFRGTMFVLQVEPCNYPYGDISIGRQSLGDDVSAETED